MKWVDITQSHDDFEGLMREMARRRARTEQIWYDAEQEEKQKRFQKCLRRQKQEDERHAMQAREAERTRKRELARRSKAEQEECHSSHMRKGKRPKLD